MMIFNLINVVSPKIMEEVMMDINGYGDQQIVPNALPFARRLVFERKKNFPL
jgi:hypothetical protein